MSLAIVIIKSKGIGALCILISNIHAISQKIHSQVTILAQKSTNARAIFKNDPHVKEVIELNDIEIKSFFGIIKKIKPKKFRQSYIFSDSVRFYLISKMAGIKESFQYRLFSKKGKNFFRTAKEFTENIFKTKINPQSKIYVNQIEIEKAKKKYNITEDTKNIVCGITASGPTKRWDISNYIKLFEKLNSKFKCRFFIACGINDENLIEQLKNSNIGKNFISFSKMAIDETIPLIGACKYYIGNDTGFGHISAGVGLRSLFLFMDSPPAAYGIYSTNISIIVPEGETIESCTHDTKGKDKISVDKVSTKAFELIS